MEGLVWSDVSINVVLFMSTLAFFGLVRVALLCHGTMLLLKLPVSMHPATFTPPIVLRLFSKQLFCLSSIHCAVNKVLFWDSHLVRIPFLLGNWCFKYWCRWKSCAWATTSLAFYFAHPSFVVCCFGYFVVNVIAKGLKMPATCRFCSLKLLFFDLRESRDKFVVLIISEVRCKVVTTVNRISISWGISFFIAFPDVVIVSLIAGFVVIKLRCSCIVLVIRAGKLDVLGCQLYLVDTASVIITRGSICHHVDHA